MRNWLRSPRQTARWYLNEWRGPADFLIRPDWRLNCPRNAAERAFALQNDDPPQVQEFDDFIAHVQATGRTVLLDIGCHFGIFCFAAIHYGGPGSRALGVDPSKPAHGMVESIANLNGMADRVRFIEAAAGAECATLEMVDTGPTGAGYVVLPSDQPAADRRVLPLVTIDALVAELGEAPTVVKIDVESFEIDVLRGGAKTFGTLGPPIFLEIHNAMMRSRGVDPGGVVSQLQQYGYGSYEIGGRPLGPEELTRDEIVRITARRGAGPAA